MVSLYWDTTTVTRVCSRDDRSAWRGKNRAGPKTLLASITSSQFLLQCPVRHGDPMQQPSMALVAPGGRVDHAAVVPHDQSALRPFVPVYVFGLGLMHIKFL